MPVKNRNNYRLPQTDSNRIAWEEYETSDADIRDGLPPEEYIRKLREEDREEWGVES